MTNNKIRNDMLLSLMWEMSISYLEDWLLEDWNTMDDKTWIDINDIISFKKEWV